MSVERIVRPLTARPSLEYERKAAKALLRRLRAGDPESLARARAQHPRLLQSPDSIRLADAQLVLAREYGFTSWPRLVRYFTALERTGGQEYHMHPREIYESSVRSLLAEHARRGPSSARTLAASVPRLFGLRREAIFATAVTEDEARLSVARVNGFPSWQALIDAVDADVQLRRDFDWGMHPMQVAQDAIQRADLSALRQTVASHPSLLVPRERDVVRRNTLIGIALHVARSRADGAIDPIIRWLESEAGSWQHELNTALLGHHRMGAEEVRDLLDRGADPNWVAPNGYSVLEHAIVRWWNGEAVDVLAERARTRSALWMAAGLGDVDGVARFLDRDGQPTAQAHADRPDFAALSTVLRGLPQSLDAEDEEVLMESFLLAMLNDRAAVMEYMASRGVPVNSLLWSVPIVTIAAGNGMASQVECLIRCGADLDLRGPSGGDTAREAARSSWENVVPKSDRFRRVAELCGHDPDAILAEKAARPKVPPSMPMFGTQALRYAGDDAFRHGSLTVGDEHLLFGLLRAGSDPLRAFTRESGMDAQRFRANVTPRLYPPEDDLQRPAMLLGAEVQHALQEATALAVQRESSVVLGTFILRAMLRSDNGAAARWLTAYGGSAETLRRHLDAEPNPHGL